MSSVAVLVEPVRRDTPGGRTKCREHFARSAARLPERLPDGSGGTPLDLTVCFPGERERVEPLPPYVRLVMLRPVLRAVGRQPGQRAGRPGAAAVRAESSAGASPAATASVPDHSRRPGRSRYSRADSGTARTGSATVGGGTGLGGPNAGAGDRNPYATTAGPIPHGHRGSRAGRPGSRAVSASASGRVAAAHRCRTPATAKHTPAASGARAAIAMTEQPPADG
ncbi:hypothetical protein [Streptomyces sp. NPDC059787]|uniref:hypothetical protein n=1 Tax=Streptomyces sp. NPDC059787 TaxID=3346947 RepID=UPI00364623B9